MYLHGLDAHGEPSTFAAVNNAACRLFGYTRDELMRLTPRAVDAPATPGQLRRVMERLMHEDSIVYESARKTRDGQQVPVEISSSMTDVDGDLMVLSISRDIAARKKKELRLEQLSLHDELTGLKNRRGFYVLLPEQGKRAKRSGARVVVLYGDIDGFKAINDRLGHKHGDQVLRSVAEALRVAFRETDLIARLGGDEFCVVAESTIRSDRPCPAPRRGDRRGRRGSRPAHRAQLRHGGHRLARPGRSGRAAHPRRHADVRGEALQEAPWGDASGGDGGRRVGIAA